jgi:hypothetical protein
MHMVEVDYAWQLIYADDIKGKAHGKYKHETLLLGLLARALVGITVDWVGYRIDYGRFELGLSESRSLWLVTWQSDILSAGAVLIRQLSEGLGRLGFAAGGPRGAPPPLLAPLYAWTAAAPAGAYLPLQPLVPLIIRHLRDRRRDGARTVPPARCPPASPTWTSRPTRRPKASRGCWAAANAAAARRPPTRDGS